MGTRESGSNKSLALTLRGLALPENGYMPVTRTRTACQMSEPVSSPVKGFAPGNQARIRVWISHLEGWPCLEKHDIECRRILIQ